jgi:hypothetical protein
LQTGKERKEEKVKLTALCVGYLQTFKGSKIKARGKKFVCPASHVPTPAIQSYNFQATLIE